MVEEGEEEEAAGARFCCCGCGCCWRRVDGAGERQSTTVPSSCVCSSPSSLPLLLPPERFCCRRCRRVFIFLTLPAGLPAWLRLPGCLPAWLPGCLPACLCVSITIEGTGASVSVDRNKYAWDW